MGKVLVGYRLAGLKDNVGCFYDAVLKVFIRGTEIIPLATITKKNTAGTLFAQWLRDGGIVPVYSDEDKGAATPPPVSEAVVKKPTKAELQKLSRPVLLKMASEEYDPTSLKDYTKADLIGLLLNL